jgi:hypothetical protein
MLDFTITHSSRIICQLPTYFKHLTHQVNTSEVKFEYNIHILLCVGLYAVTITVKHTYIIYYRQGRTVWRNVNTMRWRGLASRALLWMMALLEAMAGT